MTTQLVYWSAAGGAAILALGAGLADRARMRRRNLDRPGWVPWPLVQIAAIFAVIILAVFAVRA